MKNLIGTQLPLPFNTVASNENKKQIQNASLPENWKIKSLGDIVDFKTGKINSSGASDLGKYPFFTCSQKTLRIDNYAFDLEAILLSGNNAKGIYSVKYYQGKFNAYQRTYIITIKDIKSVSYGFLLHALIIKLEHLRTISIGTSTKYLTLGMLQNLEIVLPPIDEQRKIAVVLSLVQDAITQQEQLITLTTELKKALMQKLFTEGTRDEPQKMTEIGLIPENWDVVPLGDLLTLTQYGLSVKGCDFGNYPILRMTNQIDGKIVSKNLQYVDIEQGEFEKFKIEYGDILFNRTNSFELVGRTAIFDIDGNFVFASYLIRLRSNKEKLNSFFLNHYFNWEKTQILLKGIATRAVSQSNISASRLKGFSVPLPKKLEEQGEIVKNLDYCDCKIAVHRQKCDILNDLFRTLLHQLMTAQIRVDDLNLSALNLEPQGGEE